MKKNTKVMLLVLTLIFPAVSSAATWTYFQRIVDSFFSVNKTVVVFDADYHQCGNNKKGSLDYSVVGNEFARTFNAAMIAAKVANKRVSVKIDGCTGNVANIIGIRIGS